MKKVRLIANCIDELLYDDSYDYIGIDRGALYCMEKGIPLLCALGDFDSIHSDSLLELKQYTQIVQLPCKKNETDGEYAIRYACNLGYDCVEVFGVSGGRLDHFMVILNLLIYSSLNFKIVDQQNCIYTLNKGIHKIVKNSKYISFFPCEELTLSLKGFLYPLDHKFIQKSDIYMVSNEIVGDACVETTGKILVIESDDKKNDVR